VACRKDLTHAQTYKIDEKQQFILPLSRIQSYDPKGYALYSREFYSTFNVFNVITI